MSGSDKKARSIDELASDYFRECSALVLVFALLDRIVRSPTVEPFDWLYGLTVFGISVVLFSLGYWCERRRDRK